MDTKDEKRSDRLRLVTSDARTYEQSLLYGATDSNQLRRAQEQHKLTRVPLISNGRYTLILDAKQDQERKLRSDTTYYLINSWNSLPNSYKEATKAYFKDLVDTQKDPVLLEYLTGTLYRPLNEKLRIGSWWRLPKRATQEELDRAIEARNKISVDRPEMDRSLVQGSKENSEQVTRLLSWVRLDNAVVKLEDAVPAWKYYGMAEQLTRLMYDAKNPVLPQRIVVFRGLHYKDEDERDQVLHELKTHRYVSSQGIQAFSRSAQLSEIYSGIELNQYYGIFMIVRIPKGAQPLFLQNSLYELLLPHGTLYRLRRVWPNRAEFIVNGDNSAKKEQYRVKYANILSGTRIPIIEVDVFPPPSLEAASLAFYHKLNPPHQEPSKYTIERSAKYKPKPKRKILFPSSDDFVPESSRLVQEPLSTRSNRFSVAFV